MTSSDQLSRLKVKTYNVYMIKTTNLSILSLPKSKSNHYQDLVLGTTVVTLVHPCNSLDSCRYQPLFFEREDDI